MSKQKYLYAWKALGNGGCTYYDGKEFRYHLPRPGQRWSQYTHAPNQPETADGDSCGAGGLHLHKAPSLAYAPPYARLYLARYHAHDILGQDEGKVRVRKTSLMHISQRKFWALILRGRVANLSGAILYRANLSRANLTGADLPDGSQWSPNIDMDLFIKEQS